VTAVWVIAAFLAFSLAVAMLLAKIIKRRDQQDAQDRRRDR
jgi:membrane protein implicated in regulation of membrane protease activity